MKRSQPPQVLILGSTLAAHRVMQTLAAPLKRGEIQVGVVTEDNHCLFPELVPQVITARLGPHQAMDSARRLFAPAGLQVTEIDEVDLQQQQVLTHHSLNHRRQALHYDQLIIAMDPVCDRSAYPGGVEHGYSLLTYEACLRLRNRLLTLFELADGCSEDEERQDLLRWVVIGGSQRAVELACRLAEYQQAVIQNEYDRIKPAECQVVLLDAQSQLLSELEPAFSPAAYAAIADHARQQLARLGVRYLPQAVVRAVTEQYVLLADGQRIFTRAAIMVDQGQLPHYLQALAPGDSKKHLSGNAYLQLVGQANVWLAGECLATTPVPGRPTPVWRMRQATADTAAANLLCQVRGQGFSSYRLAPDNFFLSFGSQAAVIEPTGRLITGRRAGWRWQQHLLRLLPSWDRRLRVLADTLIWRRIGHDLVATDFRRESDYDLHYLYADAGTILQQPGDYDLARYYVLSGTVAVRQAEALVRTLGPGDTFGADDDGAISDQTVIAQGRVSLLRIPVEQLADLETIIAGLSQPLSTLESSYA